MSATGAFNVELDSLQLAFAEDPVGAEETLYLRADVEIVDPSGVFKWLKTKKLLAGGVKLTPFRKPVEPVEPAAADEAEAETKEAAEAPKAPTIYTLGFQNFCQMSDYIDLNEEVVSALAAVEVKVIISKAGADDANDDGGRYPSGQVVAQLALPVAALLMAKGCTQGGNTAFATTSGGVDIISSSVTWRFFADNNLSEFCLGCKVLQWPSASLAAPPGTWGLVYEDVVDPKAKVSKTPAELRAQYLAAIPNLVATQATLAQYVLTVGDAGEGSILPPFSLKGTISWNADQAGAVEAEQDIRAVGALWSLSWANAGGVFLSRTRVRSFIQAFASGAASAIPVTITRTPLEGGVAEGEVMTATGTIDVSELGQTGVQVCTCASQLTGEGFDEASVFNITVAVNSPLVEEVPEFAGSGSLPVKTRTVKVTPNANRDAIAELKEQIAVAVHTIGTEYLALYPPDAGQESTGRPSSKDKSFEDRKIEFLHYLSTSGSYHSLKDSLKPKIQRVVRAQFGARGQALSADKQEVALSDQLLSDLYIFLVKQCNHVLNGIFHATVVDKDDSELNKAASLDDQTESVTQVLERLQQQALDAEADGRVVDAEQRHLEKLHLLANDPSLGAWFQHDVHQELANFYLRQSAKAGQSSGACAGWGDSEGADSHRGFAEYNLSRAREALAVAVSASPDVWATRQLLACALHESGQVEEAANAFQSVIDQQLNSGVGSGLSSFSDFSGYDSDKLCPVTPLTYGVLAVHFSCTGHALRARKALRLAVRSYETCGAQPPISQHGLPRRTYVLILSQASLYFSNNGFLSLTAEATKMATQCESSADTVAKAKDLPCATAPFIRHLLKRAEAKAALFGTIQSASARELAETSVQCSEDSGDVVDGMLCLATVSSCAGDNNAAVDALSSAVSMAANAGIASRIPLECYIQCAKLLLYAGRIPASLAISIAGQQIFKSSSLALVTAISFLRTDRLKDAEVALRDANLLDNRNAEVWAYQCLVCLGNGYHKLKEAEAALNQALRLGLSASPVLRELGTAFISVDKLQTAEDLIRRALSAEGGKGSPYTRKLLGDVLAGQQQAARAIDEYQVILGDETDSADIKLRLQAAQQCRSLLITLGRTEELVAIDAIIETLRQQ